MSPRSAARRHAPPERHVTLGAACTGILPGFSGLPLAANRTIVATGNLTRDNDPASTHHCHMFRSAELRSFLDRPGLDLLWISAASALSTGHDSSLATDPALWEALLEFEEAACLDAGFLDAGDAHDCSRAPRMMHRLTRMRRVEGVDRVVVLGQMSLACGLVCGVLGLYFCSKPFSPSNFEILLDPFVLLLWIPCTLVPTFFGFAVAVVTMRGRPIWSWPFRASPRSPSGTLVAVAATGASNVFIAGIIALGAAMLSMLGCFAYARWFRRRSPGTSALPLNPKSPERRHP